MPTVKPLAVGDRAPTFTLKDQDGKAVSLADYAGKKHVVLVFYPGDMTPGCTMQLCAIRDDYSKFAAHDAIVFGVNHADVESHAAFVKKCAFPFPLLTDADRKLSTKYGATKKSFTSRVTKRTVVVIGKDGTIIYFRHGMPKNADILKAIH